MHTVMRILERRGLSLDAEFAIPISRPDHLAPGEPGHLLEIETDRNPPPAPGEPLAYLKVSRHRGPLMQRSVSFAIFRSVQLVEFEDLGVVTFGKLTGEFLWVPTAQEHRDWGIPIRALSFFPVGSRATRGNECNRVREALHYGLLNQRQLVVEIERWDKELAAFLPFVSRC